MMFSSMTSRLCGTKSAVKSVAIVLVLVVFVYICYNATTQSSCVEQDSLQGPSQSALCNSKRIVEVNNRVSAPLKSNCVVKKILKNIDNNSYYVNCSRIVYNRVPKCGSRTVLSTFKILAKMLSYSVIGLQKPSLTYNFYKKKDRLASFVKNFTEFQSPFIFSQHVHYIDFSKYSVPSPVFINVIREPTERLISHYYYNMYGSSNKPKSQLDETKSIDQCVQDGRGFCYKINELIPFFCGHEKQCRLRGTYALQKAKRVAAEHFLVIGFTEDLPSFMEVLEFLLPNYFANATEVFSNVSAALQDKTKTAKKPSVKPETMESLRQHLKMEYEFYHFTKQRFYNLLKRIRMVKQDSTRTQYYKNKRNFFKWWKKKSNS